MSTDSQLKTSSRLSINNVVWGVTPKGQTDCQQMSTGLSVKKDIWTVIQKDIWTVIQTAGLPFKKSTRLPYMYISFVCSFCSFICSSINLSVHQSIHFFVCLSVCSFICFFRLFVCSFVHSFIHLVGCMFAYSNIYFWNEVWYDTLTDLFL